MRRKLILTMISFFVFLLFFLGFEYNPEISEVSMAIPPSTLVGEADVEAQRQQECLERLVGEFNRHKTESILNSTVWNGVRHFVLFLGIDRSGTTLVGSLMDAHPNIVVANEYDAIQKWMGFTRDEKTRDYLFQALYSNSYESARIGKRRRDCLDVSKDARTKHVPNQWQGKFDKRIQIIGDKKAQQVTRHILLTSSSGGQGHNVLPSIKNVVRVPLKFVYVLRNPFDVAATKMHRQASMRVEVSERHKLYGSPRAYNKTFQLRFANLVTRISKVAATYSRNHGDQVIKIYSEDMMDNPTKELKRLCKFLEVPCSEGYFNDCSSIVLKSHSKTRNTIVWNEKARKILNGLIKEEPLFKRYSFYD